MDAQRKRVSMNILGQFRRGLKRTPRYAVLTCAPHALYRRTVLRYIDRGHQSILEAGCGQGNLARSRYFPKSIPNKIGMTSSPLTLNGHGKWGSTTRPC